MSAIPKPAAVRKASKEAARPMDPAVLRKFFPDPKDKVFRRRRNTVNLLPSRQDYVEAIAAQYGVSASAMIAFAVEWLYATEKEARTVLRPPQPLGLDDRWDITPHGKAALASIRNTAAVVGRIAP